MMVPDIPLSDPKMERALLGLLMTLSGMAQDDSTKRAMAILRPKDFAIVEHRVVYAAIIALEKRKLHFGMEQVHSLLERRNKLNGSLTHFDLEQMVVEGSHLTPFIPEEQAKQLRALGEYRDILRAVRDLTEFTGITTDPDKLRARFRELAAGLEREAIITTVQTQTFRELLATEFAPEVPVIEPLITAGDALLIVGHSKTGKSVLALQLAMAIASGGEALGVLPVHQVRDVLYINLDDKASRVKRRGQYMLAAYNGVYPERLSFAHRWPSLDRGGEGMLHTWAEAHKEGVIVIDLLERIRPHRTGNIYEADYLAMAALTDVAHTHGVTILVVHHATKAGLAPGAEFNADFSVSGSEAMRGAVDGHIVFHPATADLPDSRRITVRGRDSAGQQYQLTWDELLSGWLWEGESIQQKITKRVPFRRQQVLDTIQEASRPLKPSEIAYRLGWNPNQTYNILFEMKKHDPPQIVEVGDGTYEHPAEHARKQGTPPDEGSS
jgi:AAA domain/DnaB-like helicase N terminal domain